MKYDPRDATSAIPEGWYPAIIETVVEGQTKTKQDMQTVTFRVYGPREVTVKEFFHPASLWKYKGLARALGKLAEFNQAAFDARNFINQSLDIELSIEDSAQYGEQNRVNRFDADGSQAGGRPVAKPKPADTPWSSSGNTSAPGALGDLSDDIPF